MDMKEKLMELIDECNVQINGNVNPYRGYGIMEIARHLIANRVTVLEWHPRTEPPKKSGKYLCRYIFGDFHYLPFYQVLVYHATDEKPRFDHEGGELDVNVTHWTTLPKLPKDEMEND